MQCKLIVNSPTFTWTLLVRLEVEEQLNRNRKLSYIRLNQNTRECVRDIRTYAYHFCKCHIYSTFGLHDRNTSILIRNLIGSEMSM